MRKRFSVLYILHIHEAYILLNSLVHRMNICVKMPLCETSLDAQMRQETYSNLYKKKSFRCEWVNFWCIKDEHKFYKINELVPCSFQIGWPQDINVSLFSHQAGCVHTVSIFCTTCVAICTAYIFYVSCVCAKWIRGVVMQNLVPYFPGILCRWETGHVKKKKMQWDQW